MPIIKESIVIPVPREQVYDYLIDPAHLSEFSGSILFAERDDGPGGDIGNWPVVGSRVKGATKVLGRKVEWVVEYTELDRPHKMANRSVEGKIDFSTAYMLDPEAEGTRVTYHLETAAGLGGMFGKLADGLVNKAYERQVRADLGTLAEILTEHRNG